MEIIFEIVFELLLQVVFEAIASSGVHLFSGTKPAKPVNPFLAGVGYFLLGAMAGGLSLWIFPGLFIAAGWMRTANLVVTPVLAGAAMAAIGRWRSKHDKEILRIDRFAYGYLFALAMALVRFGFGS
jgi:hypothetical protein